MAKSKLPPLRCEVRPGTKILDMTGASYTVQSVDAAHGKCRFQVDATGRVLEMETRAVGFWMHWNP